MRHPDQTQPLPQPCCGLARFFTHLLRSFASRAVAVCAALVTAFVLSGCSSEEKAEYRCEIYYEAEASTNRDWTTSITLPLQNRSYTVLGTPRITDRSFADVLPVRVFPDSRNATGYRYELLVERPQKTSTPIQSPIAGGKPAAAVPPPPSSVPDMSFIGFLLRLDRRVERDFYQDTLSIPGHTRSILGRTIFLVVNGHPIGARRIMAPIANGEIHFHSQLAPLTEIETPEETEARIIQLAKDINHSIVLLQKQPNENK